MSRDYNVAVVGATGMVGEVLIELLAERNFPVEKLFPVASEASAGKRIRFKESYATVHDLAKFDFSKVDIAFFSAGAAVSKQYAPVAADQGCIVIDNTSCFRYEKNIPLIVPEVNLHALDNYREQGIIANPNCSTIQLMLVLKPIHDAFGVTRVQVATYQSVSGAGRSALEELATQTGRFLNAQQMEEKLFPRQIAFNVIPQIDDFEDNGYTREEMKIHWEAKKILEDPDLLVSATAVRVPVFVGHAEAVNIETRERCSAEDIVACLKRAPGVKVRAKPEKYPTPAGEVANQDDVWVGRIRNDISSDNAINLWIVGDNLRKGGALNAIQIAEFIVRDEVGAH